MKGYAMKSSPFKQNAADDALKSTNTNYERYDDGKVILGNQKKVEAAGDIVRTEITRNKTWDDLRNEGMSEADITKAKAWRKENPDEARDQVGTGEFQEEQGPSTFEDSNNEVVAKTARKGQVQTAYQSRNNLRRGFQANRKLKRGEWKTAKARSKGKAYYKDSEPDADGNTKRVLVTDKANVSSKELKKAGRIAKRDQAKKDRAARKADPTLSAKEQRRARNATKREVNAEATKIKRANKENLKGDKSEAKAKQYEANTNLAKSESRNAQIQSTQGKSGFSRGDRSLVQDEVNLQQGERPITDQGNATDSPIEMNKPGFFEKKSPMKMNYFKK
tara:strand:- start:16 stop:1017 length:1002 start_codon:yes stop_codon:yes gene_type:complete